MSNGVRKQSDFVKKVSDGLGRWHMVSGKCKII